MSDVRYTEAEMKERMDYIQKNKKTLCLSEQYGMYFLLTNDNEILFNLGALVMRDAALKGGSDDANR